MMPYAHLPPSNRIGGTWGEKHVQFHAHCAFARKTQASARLGTPFEQGSNQQQHQLLDRVGVAKRAPRELDALVEGIKLHRPRRSPQLAATEQDFQDRHPLTPAQRSQDIIVDGPRRS